jgi:hypothetical protein
VEAVSHRTDRRRYCWKILDYLRKRKKVSIKRYVISRRYRTENIKTQLLLCKSTRSIVEYLRWRRSTQPQINSKSFRSELKNRNFHSLTYVFHHVLVNMVISPYIFQLLASLVAFDLFAPLHNRILLYSFKHFYHREMLLNLSCYSYLQLEGSIDIVVNSATLLPSIPPCRFTFKLTSYPVFI